MLAAAGTASAASRAAAAVPVGPHQFLALAKEGLAAAHRAWWNPRLGWYDDTLDRSWHPTMPLAYLWTAFPLFEATDAVALAEPTAANRAAVRAFASKAEQYWNPTLKPVGGYAYYIDTRTQRVSTYFDDNGWWGLAFVDAFRATGDRRYLNDAARAFDFIVRVGWDPGAGGIWWDTGHGHKTSEPLAAAAYIGAALYQHTRAPAYLKEVVKLLDWAREHSWNSSAQLYSRNDTDQTVMDYVQGMMIGADLELCQATGDSQYCLKAKQLGQASLHAFSSKPDWSATADGLYLRFMLDLYRYDGDRQLYKLVYQNGIRALTNARDSATDLYAKDWAGNAVPGELLRTHAGTVALLAWLATTSAPA
jgi:Glycosyl hydrolase family 76